MDYVKLGTSGIEVSRIGLGTWAMGGFMWGGTNEEEAVNAILQALDLGINLIDTAPIYGFGLSEEIVGRAVIQHGRRDKVIIATKAGIEWHNDIAGLRWRNSTREHIIKEVDDSLRRLRTDYIDLYQIHWPDYETPIEETAEAMLSLYEKGKIRAIGVSNYSVEQMEQWLKVAPLHSSQPPFNLFQSNLADTVFKYCSENHIATLSWGTLAHGMLTGKFTADAAFPEDDFRHSHPMFQGERFHQYLGAVEELKNLAAEKGKTVTELAVRWALQQPGINVALWGARRPEQLNVIQGVFGWELSQADLDCIDRILAEQITDPVPVVTNPGPPARSTAKK